MKCPYCGKELIEGIKFCGKCGREVSNPETAAKPLFPETEETGKRSKNLGLIIAVCSAAVAVVAFVFLFVFLNGNNNSNHANDQVTVTTIAASNAGNAEQVGTAENPGEKAAEEKTEKSAEETKNDVSDKITVPDVVGLRSDDACKRLSDCGLVPDRVLTESDSVQADFVISQSPVGDKKVDKGAKVVVYISKNDKKTESSNNDVYLYCRASDYATLRDRPSRAGNEITKVSSRERVTFIGTEGEFYYVSYNGKKGYVLGDFFSTDPNAPLNYGSGNAEPNNSSTLYCCASDYATLRSSASRSSSALATVKSRQAVTYLGDSGEFYYVSFNGQKGYVLKAYFSIDPDAPLNYGDN